MTSRFLLSSLKIEAICSSETSVDNGIHGAIFQKMVLFITNAVRTSDPETHFNFRLSLHSVTIISLIQEIVSNLSFVCSL
jgi:hypothetical protein